MSGRPTNDGDEPKGEAETIRELIDAGYETDSVIAAVMHGDNTMLKHTGMVSALGRTRSVLDEPCRCTGNPGTYEYRGDKRQHCMWCDGLREDG